MGTIRKSVWLARVLLTFSTFGLLSQAQGGRIKIKPYVDLQTRYEDNIFLESTGPDAYQSDMSIVITPGISVEWPVWDLFLQAFYQAGFGFYLDFNDNNYITHTFGGLFRYTPTRSLSLGVSDTLEISQLPQAGNETFTYNKIMGQIKYEWLSGLGTSATVHHSNYEDPSPSASGNFDETGYSLSQSYQPTSKTNFVLSGSTRTREFENRPLKDYDENMLRLMTRYTPWDSITTWVGPGIKWRSFHDQDETAFLLSLKAKVQPTNHEVTFGYDYDVVDTFEELQIEEFEGLTTEFTSERTYSEIRTYAADYTHLYRQKFSVNWIWDFLPNTTLLTHGTYQINDYNIEVDTGIRVFERKDNVFIGSLGIQQKFTKWLIVILKYTYLTRTSNIREEKYDANRIGIEVLGSF